VIVIAPTGVVGDECLNGFLRTTENLRFLYVLSLLLFVLLFILIGEELLLLLLLGRR